MIRQPNFVTQEVVDKAFEYGLAVQMMHIGSYDNEPQSFELMKEFIEDNNLEIATLIHREIYISDARKCEVSKLKTFLRYRVVIKIIFNCIKKATYNVALL
ncbi:hypothetical protein GKZ28_18065 [Clostridium chromiireducens]|uniref:GyrI-like small molecule binding domain-containing protein n=1 Tax=Clostridium chromiireducens TaxID=225345 RepID=A0A964W3Q1_9CLOT|nr:GyrI-like domain-containing protein [Clostridium chromiireducens]MVX65590.1 hypothetical protein [Clostridium chromiireducens]